MRQRDYKMDNLRFILILCVLMGHFMELFKGELTSDLYKIIYSFHMPAFLFLTGFFARFDRRKIVLNLMYPYILFQILYQVFDALIIQEKETFSIEFGTPYWLLWYLLVTIYCYLLLPLLGSQKSGSQAVIMGISLLFSLLAGLDNSLGYYGSLSRFFSFLPFFLAGYYTAHRGKKEKNAPWIALPIGLFLILASYYIIENPDITKKVLYASYSYEKAGHNPIIKSFLLLVGFAWIAFLFLMIPTKRLPFLSVLGQHTLPVFLLHGFLVRLAKKYAIFCYSEAVNLLLAVIFSIAIICIFGNPWFAKWFQKLFTGNWLERQKNK